MGAHLVMVDGEQAWQSDKYPTCPPGKVPLSVKDKAAQPLLWKYAQSRRAIDAEFSDDLETALRAAGFVPPTSNPQRHNAALAAVEAAIEIEIRAIADRLGSASRQCQSDANLLVDIARRLTTAGD